MGFENVTLKIVDNSGKDTGKTYTCNVENKSFINSIITIGENNSIKKSDIDKLQEVAKRSNDYGIIEQSDLNGHEKKNLALANNFDEYYDIKVSDDGKYLQVTIKEALKDPNLADIKADFGVKDGVFVKKGDIPHGNEDVIPSSSYGAGFDSIVIPAGKTINIPVSEINIDGSPRGAFLRILSFFGN